MHDLGLASSSMMDIMATHYLAFVYLIKVNSYSVHALYRQTFTLTLGYIAELTVS